MPSAMGISIQYAVEIRRRGWAIQSYDTIPGRDYQCNGARRSEMQVGPGRQEWCCQ